jgi:hypothetical protein
MPAALTAATDPEAERAAEATLKAHGRSVDAVIAAFFAAAGADAAALCAPVVALVAGVGMGVRWFDGRSLQPGSGARRPRGLVAGAPIPAAAYVAVPRAVAMVTVLHAYGASLSLAALVRRGAALADEQGSARRAALLRAIGRRAAGAMRTSEVQRHLLVAAGPASGGLLSEADLESALPDDGPAELVTVAPGLGVALPPAAAEARARLRSAGSRGSAAPARRGTALRSAHYAVAADSRGVVAALAWAPDAEGLLVPELELRLTRDAVPVMRGISRLTPGTTRPAAAPIALLARPSAGWFAALGLEGARSLDAAAFEQAPASLRELLERLLARSGGRSASAASVERRRTALTRVAAIARDAQSPGTL